MKKKINILQFFLVALLIGLAIAFVVKFGGPKLLRVYVEAGIGTCKKVPILCRVPEAEVISPKINKEFITELVPYKFSEMEIFIPKGFRVVKQLATRVYYKKKKDKDSGSIFYLLYEPKDFFVNLSPQVKAGGVSDDYEFLRRTMYARPDEVKNLIDAFFVVTKSLFIPDMGDQSNVIMTRFVIENKKGFLNYNLSPGGNYFDFNMLDNQGNFFKVCIKDKQARLDLDKAFAIISTCSFLP